MEKGQRRPEEELLRRSIRRVSQRVSTALNASRRRQRRPERGHDDVLVWRVAPLIRSQCLRHSHLVVQIPRWRRVMWSSVHDRTKGVHHRILRIQCFVSPAEE